MTCEYPRRIAQVCEITLHPIYPLALSADDNDDGFVEQWFHVQVVRHDWGRDSSENEVHFSVTQLAEFRSGHAGGCLYDLHREAWMPVCYPLNDSSHEATGYEGHISADAGFSRAWMREKFDISQALLQRIGARSADRDPIALSGVGD
jgi:hypothetical protein